MTTAVTDRRAVAVATRTRSYAAKWLVEHDFSDRPGAATFAHCARRPPAAEYPAIRAAVEARRIELRQEGHLP